MNKIQRYFEMGCMLLLLTVFDLHSQSIYLSGTEDNDLYLLLKKEKISVKRFDTPFETLQQAEIGSGVIITASNYPHAPTVVKKELYEIAKKRRIRLYVEYLNEYPGLDISPDFYRGRLERGVISSRFFLPNLSEMELLALNDCHIYKTTVKKPLITFSKVAGFDFAEFGLTDSETYPLLFMDKNTIVAMSCLTNFKTARYVPNKSWRYVWEHILKWLTNNKSIQLTQWSSDPATTYSKVETLPSDARMYSVKRGAEWLFNGRFLVHPSWEEWVLENQGDGTAPFGPPVGTNRRSGNGSNGVLEGHASVIYADGTEQYRYWLRNDVQGEVAFLLASASHLLSNSKYAESSENIMDYMFYTADFRKGARKDTNSASYGLLGWANTHSHVFYNDDNARAILGVIGASAYLKNERWNQFIVECILANLMTSSKQGFQGGRLEEPQILEKGRQYYHNRDYINPHPHFESWMWACYLWLYDKTKHPLLLHKAKSAIRITMEAYPDQWGWTNGIQQERARMILPLAWLVRIEDIPEHRKWLDWIVQDLLKNQVDCGAIREELGTGTGMFGSTRSNKEYGLHEAPLIEKNGDPVADMLYTCNFAYFALNEAAHATCNSQYKESVRKLSDFLTRIQVKSTRHIDLDGAWMRAFDYNRWDYWASNADAGWGAWSTLTGWIQSWIVATQALLEKDQSFWSITRQLDVEKQMQNALWMLDE